MNRTHRALAASFVALAGLSFGSSSARAQAPAVPAPAPVPAFAPAATTPPVRGAILQSHVGDPIPAGPGRTRPYYRDWSTGRDVRLAKPWLQPLR